MAKWAVGGYKNEGMKAKHDGNERRRDRRLNADWSSNIYICMPKLGCGRAGVVGGGAASITAVFNGCVTVY